MPVSVQLGSRPRQRTTRSYSSSVSPISRYNFRSRIISGAGSRDRGDFSGCTALPPIFQHRSKESHSIRRTHPLPDRPFRMGHQAQDISLPVDDPGDGVHRTVGIFPGVTENDLAVLPELRQGLIVAVVIALTVGDGNADRLPGAVVPGKGEPVGLHPEPLEIAAKLQMIVPPHRSGEQPRLEKDLKTVADADDQLALGGGLPHPL